MGLLDKTNRRATPTSVLRASAIGAAVGMIVFFLCFKPMYRDAWPVTLPIWILLCAAVAALCEWQVPPQSAEDDDPHEPAEDEKANGKG